MFAMAMRCIPNNELTLDLSDDEIENRKASWVQPEAKEKRGVLAKYAKLVSSASLGAITDGD